MTLPPFAQIDRSLGVGLHPYLGLLPGAATSPAMRRITTAVTPLDALLARARVQITPGEGFAWVDDDIPAIVLMEHYYRGGNDLDLYLDLLHELTHLRQAAEGMDIWDERFAYVDRITEIEGYAVAVEEGRRLGMTDEHVLEHLSNPWMSAADVQRLCENVRRFLAAHPLG